MMKMNNIQNCKGKPMTKQVGFQKVKMLKHVEHMKQEF